MFQAGGESKPMSATEAALGQGRVALASGDWEGARAAFEAALEEAPSPEAEEGMGHALWWLQDVDGAIFRLEQAYAGFRERGDAALAASVALWLSREYAAVYGNAAAASGWYARAEGLLRGTHPGVQHGWLALTRAERASEPAEVHRNAQDALRLARRLGDPDLEAAALARLGYAEVATGEVEAGTEKIDEAMAAATGGEVKSLETIGDVTCVAGGLRARGGLAAGRAVGTGG